MSNILVDNTEDWFYEGNISKKYVKYLKKKNYIINKDNSNNIKAKGIDIIAEKNSELLLVEVKGYPSEYYVSGKKQGEKKVTNPKLQATHYFSNVLVACIYNYNYENKNNKKILLIIVLPKFHKYIELIENIKPFIQDFKITLHIDVIDEKDKVLRLL